MALLRTFPPPQFFLEVALLRTFPHIPPHSIFAQRPPPKLFLEVIYNYGFIAHIPPPPIFFRGYFCTFLPTLFLLRVVSLERVFTQ